MDVIFVVYILSMAITIVLQAAMHWPSHKAVTPPDEDSTDEFLWDEEPELDDDAIPPGSMIELGLVAGTGRGRKEWMDFIGASIANCTDPDTKFTEVADWLDELLFSVWEGVEPRIDLTKVDENIATAKQLAVILTLWTARIMRAKAYDARRPLKDRERFLVRLEEFAKQLSECVCDESMDPTYFPDQEWQSPYNPEVQKLKEQT